MSLHHSIQVVLRFEDYFILQRRDHDPSISGPGLIGFFGGSIEGDESPLEAARRELREEIGEKIDLSGLKPIDEQLIHLHEEFLEDFDVQTMIFELQLEDDVFTVNEGEGKISITLDELDEYKDQLVPFVYQLLMRYKTGEF